MLKTEFQVVRPRIVLFDKLVRVGHRRLVVPNAIDLQTIGQLVLLLDSKFVPVVLEM